MYNKKRRIIFFLNSIDTDRGFFFSQILFDKNLLYIIIHKIDRQNIISQKYQNNKFIVLRFWIDYHITFIGSIVFVEIIF